MLYRNVPKNGDELSILGFGCMRFQEKDGRIDELKATHQLHLAIDGGVNYLDTAWPYHSGQSEPFLGRALTGGYRDKVRLATKLPSWLVQKREDMDQYLADQLERLNTDRIDYYLLHALDGGGWDKLVHNGVVDFLDQAKADGRIRNAGFSFHGALTDFKRIVDAYPWEICQIQYNYLDTQFQAGSQGLAYAAEKDLGIIVMEPLRGGNLGLASPPPRVKDVWESAPIRRPPVEWALRWIWHHPAVTVVLSGMNDDAHINQNLRIADQAHPNSLSPQELEIVRRAARQYRKIMKIDCTGCRYCMPCPSGVGIPNCFDVYNTMEMFGDVEKAKLNYVQWLYDDKGDAHEYASRCTQCGECLEKCPQQLEIPDLLETVAEAMEGGDLKDRENRVKKLRQLQQ